MRNKLLALLLGTTMVLSLAACGQTENKETGKSEEKQEESKQEESKQEESTEEEADPFAEHLTISIGMIYLGGTEDDAFLDHIEEKFNCDIELVAIADAGAANILATSDSLPTMAIVDGVNVADLVDQGLVGAFPDGWDTKYPNLARVSECSGMREASIFDGKDYAVYTATYGMYGSFDTLPNHQHLIYRKDWAEQVGMADFGKDYIVTESELKDFIDALKENNLGTIQGMGANAGNMELLAHFLTGVELEAFIDTGSEWIYNPATEEYKAFIEKIREWHEGGYLMDDWYLGSSDEEVRNLLMSGQIGVVYNCGVGQNYEALYNTFEQETGEDAWETFGHAQVAKDDGSLYMNALNNYWTLKLLSPNASEAEIDRVLAIADYMSTKEGVTVGACGIQGVDWEYAEDGETIRVLDETAKLGAKYTSKFAIQWMGYCGDDFGLAVTEGGTPKEYIDLTLGLYGVFTENATGKATLWKPSVEYMMFQSEAKNNYSVSLGSKAIELAIGTDDISTAWDIYMDEQSAVWEPVVEDLNAEFYGK